MRRSQAVGERAAECAFDALAGLQVRATVEEVVKVWEVMTSGAGRVWCAERAVLELLGGGGVPLTIRGLVVVAHRWPFGSCWTL
jgi:hypothetical protein